VVVFGEGIEPGEKRFRQGSWGVALYSHCQNEEKRLPFTPNVAFPREELSKNVLRSVSTRHPIQLKTSRHPDKQELKLKSFIL